MIADCGQELGCFKIIRKCDGMMKFSAGPPGFDIPISKQVYQNVIRGLTIEASAWRLNHAVVF